MNFLRKLLGINDLRSTIARLNDRLVAVECANHGLQVSLHSAQQMLCAANRRHTRLQSQMITYSLQQRAKEAAETVTYECLDSSLELGNILTGGSPLEDLPFKRVDGPLVHNRLSDTFTGTITDRAVAALKVADPLPATHTAVEAQEARNKRYSTVAASTCAAMAVPYSRATWRSAQDHYDNFSPSWFCPDLVSIGQLRNRALLLADVKGLELKTVKNAHRTFVNSYPAPLLFRAQFELHNEAVLNRSYKEQE
jgi:hypothetical protein